MHGPKSDGSPQTPLNCDIYLDDFTVSDDSLDGCLDQTYEAIKRLADAGAMLSMKKSIIGADEGRILGHRWHSGGLFTAEDKKLRALLELPHAELAAIPTSSLFGLLNFFRCYVPDFAVRTEAIRKLLSAAHSTWTEEHTTCLKETITQILEALPVINFSSQEPVRMQYRVGPAGMAGVLLQKDPKSG